MVTGLVTEVTVRHPAVFIFLLLVISAAALPVMAQPAGDIRVGVGVSALDPAVDGTYRINDAFGMWLPGGYPSVELDDGSDGIDYHIEGDLGGIALLGDYFTGLGGLRVSAGALYSRHSADGRGRGDGAVGNADFTDVALRLDAGPTNRLMPVASLGYHGRIGTRWTLSADLGAVYSGGYDIALRDVSAQASQQNTDADIDDDLPDFQPYVKFTVGFRF